LRSTPLWLTAFGLLIPALLQAQLLHRPFNPVYNGITAYSAYRKDVLAIGNNQATLAELTAVSAGLYSEKRFMQKGLDYYQLAVDIPTGLGHAGIKTVYAGGEGYSETQLGLVYARRLGNLVSLGVQFNYNGVSAAGYGNAAIISAEAGLLMHVTGKLHAGVQVSNPVGGRFGYDKHEKLPSVYKTGLGYDVSEQLFIGVQLVKEEGQPLNVQTGICYQLLHFLTARAGVQSSNGSFYLGVGLIKKSFRIDIVANYHNQLGYTPALVLLFEGRKKEP